MKPHYHSSASQPLWCSAHGLLFCAHVTLQVLKKEPSPPLKFPCSVFMRGTPIALLVGLVRIYQLHLQGSILTDSRIRSLEKQKALRFLQGTLMPALQGRYY